MATIKDLCKSISEMSNEEIEKRLLENRRKIREPKGKFQKAAVKREKKENGKLAEFIKKLSPQEKAKLISELTGD